MKNYLLLFAIVLAGTCVAQDPPGTKRNTAAPGKVDFTVQQVTTQQLAAEGNFQQQLNELNPVLDAYLISNKELELELAIVNTQTGRVVRKPSPSEFVLLAADANLLAVAGKRVTPGHYTADGLPLYDGVEVWDVDGRLVFSDTHTGLIHYMLMGKAGNLLIDCEHGLRMYEPNGKLRWQRTHENAEVKLVNNIVTLDLYDFGSAMHTTMLLDGADGSMIRLFTHFTSDVLEVVYADADRFVVSHTNGQFWALDLYNRKEHDALSSIQTLPGRPRFLQPLSGGVGIGFHLMLQLPQRGALPHSNQVAYAAWVPSAQMLTLHELGSFDVHRTASGIYSNANEDRNYSVRMGSQIVSVKTN